VDDSNSVIGRMERLLAGWETSRDRRLIFLHCYKLMTANILTAVQNGEFEDNAWVRALMEIFAGHYFKALDAFESGQGAPPAAWMVAFKASGDQRTHVLQNLMLGVNAHINFDLVFALCELLETEWAELSNEQRKVRYRDHCRVNEIIDRTTNAVQDQVIDRFVPVFGLVDTLLGPLDEWMATLLISNWREEVWQNACQMLNSGAGRNDPETITLVEKRALERARDILGQGGLTDLLDFL
jgi:hypothetical protein